MGFSTMGARLGSEHRRAKLTKDGEGRYLAEDGRFRILGPRGNWKVVDTAKDNVATYCMTLDDVRIRVAAVIDNEKNKA